MRIADIYRRFASAWPEHDFSDAAASEMFAHESRGAPVGEANGFALGKKWMDVTVKMWRKDIAGGLLRKSELDYPDWFLRRVL